MRQRADRPAGEATLRRGTDVDDCLAIEDVGFAAQDREEAFWLRLARPREHRPVALRAELAERDERAELATGALVELRHRATEWRIAEDRDDEDVGNHVPGAVP